MDNPWIKCSEELPPCDGMYQVTNSISPPHIEPYVVSGAAVIGLMEYDGFGFNHNGIYITPKYWRFYQPIIKRYGKVTKDES